MPQVGDDKLKYFSSSNLNVNATEGSANQKDLPFNPDEPHEPEENELTVPGFTYENHSFKQRLNAMDEI